MVRFSEFEVDHGNSGLDENLGKDPCSTSVPGLTLAFWFSFLISVTQAQKMPESALGSSVPAKFLE